MGVEKDPAEAFKWYMKAAEQGYSVSQCNIGLCYCNGAGVEKDAIEAFKWYMKAAEQGDRIAQYNIGWCYGDGAGVEKDPAESFKWYTKAAEQGNSDAQYKIGICYDDGAGVEKDPAESFKWYMKAAEQGNSNAQCNIGCCYEKGAGVEKDAVEAFKWYMKAAEQGNSDAHCNIGCCYSSGNGIEKDPVESFKWYMKAAEQGNSDAQFNIGCCYDDGTGIEKDAVESFKWYIKAAEQGNSDAQFKVGWLYDEGEGVEKNPAEAFKWYMKVAEQGNSDAQFNIGCCYDDGTGVEKDPAEAFKWYMKAAEQGNSYAQCNTGCCYDYGTGVEKDAVEAFKWYMKAAEQGDSYAQFKVGWFYYKGESVEKDPAEAFKWYMKAAEQGNSDAQFNIGCCYDDGTGVEKDPAEAFNWYMKAAEQGNSYAQCNIGCCYDNGTGVEKDPVESFKWYMKAAEQGNSYAQFKIDLCYGSGDGVEDPVESFNWFMKAAEQGNSYAQYNIGLCYANGARVEKNPAESFKWFMKAAEQGNSYAQFKVGRFYDKGEGVVNSPAELFKWYMKAAEQGHRSAQYNIGCCYEKGAGVEKDPAESFKWYMKAADQGDRAAVVNVARMHHEGRGVTQDDVNAIALLRSHKAEEAICRVFPYDEQYCERVKLQSCSGLFPTPFVESDGPAPRSFGIPRSLRELEMIRLSAAIREKAEWRRKMCDPHIVARWKEEALSQGATPAMFRYVLKELEYYASLVCGAIEPSSVDGTWRADNHVPAELRAKLLAGVEVLENVPDRLKDFHPGSHGQVVDLVHPSLHCYVEGLSRTTACDANPPLKWIGGGSVGGWSASGDKGDASSDWDTANANTSKIYQWLPMEIDVDERGRAAIRSYINNLHPYHHRELYGTIASIFECFVPLFSRVLTDMLQPCYLRLDYHCDLSEEQPDTISLSEDDEEGRGGMSGVTARDQGVGGAEADNSDGNHDNDDDGEDNGVGRVHQPGVPTFCAAYPPSRVVGLRGRRLQVIVKLANIVLTPDNPEYAGGVWNVEGMRNEHIVASGIYYYASDNISESCLHFRAAVNEPRNAWEYDGVGIGEMYGSSIRALNQELGSVVTKEGRCISFPNTLQHRVAPFRLIDGTRPGVRKILVFFLVDPTERILSTLNVPPQQREWLVDSVCAAGGEMRRLPLELVHSIVDHMEWPMSLKVAKKHREALMAERKYFVDEHTREVFERKLSLCEH